MGMRLREELVEVAYFCGAPDRAVAAFSWMVAKHDANPEWNQYDLLWKYKWITEHFPFMHQIDAPTIERTLDDMQQRYERAGYDRRPVTNLRAWNAMWQGDADAARHHRADWWDRPRDGMADCRACEVSYNVQYHVEFGEPGQALTLAKDLLSRRLGCAEIPHITFGFLVWPLLEEGRAEEAQQVHSAGYELIRNNRDFVMEAGEHIAFAAHQGDLDGATSMFERHLPWVIDNPSWLKSGHLIAAGEGLMHALGAGGASRVSFRLPRQLAAALGEEAESVAAVEQWLRKRRLEIGAVFDARNGSDFVSRRLERVRQRAQGTTTATTA